MAIYVNGKLVAGGGGSGGGSGSGTPAKMVTATLSMFGWEQSTQIVSVQGVLPSNQQAVIISPATKADADAYMEMGVWLTSQGTNILTFSCEHAPTANISLNVLMLEAE